MKVCNYFNNMIKTNNLRYLIEWRYSTYYVVKQGNHYNFAYKIISKHTPINSFPVPSDFLIQIYINEISYIKWDGTKDTWVQSL